MTGVSSGAIANLSSIIRDVIHSHDKFKEVTSDTLRLNVTIYNQIELCVVIQQLVCSIAVDSATK